MQLAADGSRAAGEMLRRRRESLRPADVGLPDRPRRRTPGLRREEVAAMANISPTYYSATVLLHHPAIPLTKTASSSHTTS